jgi:adenylate cyclase
MEVISIEAIRNWFVDNESFLSSVTALIALSSVALLGLQKLFRPLVKKGEEDRDKEDGRHEDVARLVDDSPAIAVLPFRKITDGSEEIYLGDSIPEDISVNLSYARLFPVISASTSFMFRDSKKTVAEIGGELGARYLITGTIAKASEKLRLVVEVADCKTGRQLWSDRFVWDSADVFNLQEEISDSLIAKLSPVIHDAEMTRARRTPPQSAAAFDHVMKGMWHDNQVSREESLNAIREYEIALELDPDYANAHALLGATLYDRAYIGWSEDPMADFMRAGREARLAISLDPNIAEAHLILCYNALVTREFEASEEHARRALELNPCNGRCWLGAGLVALYRGRHEEASEHFARVQRLNPNDPSRWVFHLSASLAAMMSGDFEKALDFITQARSSAHESARMGGDMLACAALIALGREGEAREILDRNLERFRRNLPKTLARMPFEDPGKVAFIMELISRLDPELFPNSAPASLDDVKRLLKPANNP